MNTLAISAALGTLLLTSALVGCGSANSPAAGTSSSPFANAKDLPSLYEAAKREGEVVFKGGLEDYVAADLGTAFTRKYPGLKLTHAVVPNGQVPPQIITESTANKISTDVGFGNINDVLPLDERGLLLKYDWAQLLDPRGQVELDGKMLHMYDTVSVLGYNTDHITAEASPKTWEDLLAAKYGGGKMGFTSLVGPVFGGAALERGEAETLAYLEKLKAQKPVFTSKGAEVAQQLAAGQLLVGSMPLAQFMDLKSKGAPAAIASVSPFTVTHLNVYTVNGAPHPNAALLFLAWTTTDEAHQILAKSARDQVTPCSAGLAAQQACNAGVKFIPLDTVDKMRHEAEFQAKAQKSLGITPG